MAESATAEAGAAMSPAGPDIKLEPAAAMEELGCQPAPTSAQNVTKRPYQDVGEHGHERESNTKKVKTENDADQDAADSLEDGLALLVQNALSNVNGLVDGIDSQADAPMPTNESVEPSTETQAYEELAPEPATFESDPETHVRTMTLHALGNISISILLLLSTQPQEATIRSLQDLDSRQARPFRQLGTTLEAMKGVYSEKPLLLADDLGLRGQDTLAILELANLAQIGVWLAEAEEESFTKVDSNMALAFPTPQLDLPAKVAELYLAVKTQQGVRALLSKDPQRSAEEALNEAMLCGLEDKFRERRGFGQDLTSADRAFVASVQARKAALQAAAQHGDVAPLKDKYPREDALRVFGAYLRGWLASVSELGSKLGVAIPPNDEPLTVEPEANLFDAGGMDLDDLSSFFEKTASGLVQSALAGFSEREDDHASAVADDGLAGQNARVMEGGDHASDHGSGKMDFMNDYKELEALVAESTSNYVKTTLNGLSPVPYQPTVPTSTTENLAAQAAYHNSYQQNNSTHTLYSQSQQPQEPQAPSSPIPGTHLPPNQSFPSAILYDKARQAAITKQSAHTRREGLHSTRRPWTQEEEKALMAGLDMVKGPHWSQILTLFGPNGTISDILKDRTQVQLKDKARNLKLFFLKTNSEMPYYLQAVTGELKTRAPTQAARKEAEERARLNSEEDQAKLQGILALAGGLQPPPPPPHQQQQQGTVSASPSKSRAPAVVTPAQAVSTVKAASPGRASPQTVSSSSATTQPASVNGHSNHSVQSTAQQVLQSIAQAQPRPHGQLPSYMARQQSLGQQPASWHQNQQNARQSPGRQANAAANPSIQSPSTIPVRQEPASSLCGSQSAQTSTMTTATATTSSSSSSSSTAAAAAAAAPATHSPNQLMVASTEAPTTGAASDITPLPEAPGQGALDSGISGPMSHSAPQHEDQGTDDAAEAALLQGLQAAVAEASSF